MKKISITMISFTAIMILMACSPAARMPERDIKTKVQAPEGDGRLESFYEKYKDAKHRLGASGPDAFDCSGFAQKAFKDIYGISLPRTSQSQYFMGSRIQRINDLKYGDLVFFNTDGKGVSHVGIYLYEYQFMHASSSLGVTISNITMDYWSRRFIEGRRLKL
jgi:murein DD-endopeptidase / murein LD-carboxypeptidase